VYDPSSNYYLSKMLDPANWRNGDIETGLPYYLSMSNAKDGYANDTLVQVRMAMAMWKLQMHRDLYLTYGDEMDYSIEGGTGGPINDAVRMFIAVRSNVSHPMFPTEQPDRQRQVMANVASDLGDGASLRVSGGIAENNTNVFPSSNGLGYYNWLWDRILSIQYQRSINSQLGVRFSKALSASTFYDIKVNALRTTTKFGSSPWPSSIPDSLFGASKITTALSLTDYTVGPDKFSYLRGADDFRDERTLTVSLEGSFTSQVTKNHMVNTGIQFNQYLINSSGYNNTAVAATLQTRRYDADPAEIGLYVQDKMEFEGMIANIGLRLDIWDANKKYYVNQFNPFAVRDTSGLLVSNYAQAATAQPPILGRLQPRAGVSFPIDVTTVFHLNYGAFMQRPSFQYIVANTLEYDVNGAVKPIVLGNPRLKPQVTNSYDVGVTKGLGEGFTLDISGYYKDVADLIEQANFTDQRSGVTYSTYFNRDYADIRGFRLALSKRKGELTGSVNYQFGVATGKSATVSNAPPSFTLDTLNRVKTELLNVPSRDITLDFDRTHNLVITLSYRTEEDWGPSIGDIYLFGNVSVSSNSFVRSGRPYTSSFNNKLINGARSPAEYNTNLKMTKKVLDLFGTNATFYCEVFNLFENRILNYSYLFPKVNAGQSNDVITKYERYPIDDRSQGVLYWNDTNDKTGFPVDQSFLVYDNAPRSFNFGIMLEF
jgi:outer membrane receptor protein involved in Fe transport